MERLADGCAPKVFVDSTSLPSKQFALRAEIKSVIGATDTEFPSEVEWFLDRLKHTPIEDKGNTSSASGIHQHTPGHAGASGIHQDTSGIHRDTSGIHYKTCGIHHHTSGIHQHTSGILYNKFGIQHNTSGIHPLLVSMA